MIRYLKELQRRNVFRAVAAYVVLGWILLQVAGGLEEALSLPAWFDKARFLEGAKGHFTTLQAAWDANDLERIREYVTPALHAELVRERARLHGPQHTEVVSLHTELAGFETQADHVLASVRYSGLIREAPGAQPQAFSEIWHVQRSTRQQGADWFVAGIQQEGAR